MRLSLLQTCVLGSLAVAAASAGLAPLLGALGVALPAWATALAALGLGAALGALFSRPLVRSSRGFLEAAGRLAEGDLAARVELPGSPLLPHESGELARRVGRLLEALGARVLELQQTSDRVSAASRDLSLRAEGASQGHGEISATVDEVAKGASQQQGLLGDVSRLVHDSAAAIELNASRAREAFGFSAEANQKAHAGVEVSRLAIEKMRTVFEHVEQAGGRVFQLEAKTRHVHQITEIITSVASRTNLLSLNASIEAARAGEAGRGFAVVAEEIRKLAESAARSADEISKLIHEIEADTQSVADQMRQSGQMITEGREDVNTIAHSLEQIRAAVGEASARAEEIFQEADQQARDAERMVGSMDEISKVSQANGEAVAAVAVGFRRQVEVTGEMLCCARDLTELSRELQALSRGLRTPEPASAG